MSVATHFRTWLWLLVACIVICCTHGLPSGPGNAPTSTSAISGNSDVEKSGGNSSQDGNLVEDPPDLPPSLPSVNESSALETVRQEIISNENNTILQITCPSSIPPALDADPTPSYSISDANTTVSDVPLNIGKNKHPTPSYSISDANTTVSDVPLNIGKNLTAFSVTATPETLVVDLPNFKNGPDSVAKVDFSTLEFNRNVEVSMESKGCQTVAIEGGVPDWVERLSLSADGGRVILQNGWARGATNLKKLWLRISEGLIVDDGLGARKPEEEIDLDVKDKDESHLKNLCQALPATLELFDASHTPLKILQINEHCSVRLLHLEASHSGLKNVALCMPSLITLQLPWNSIEGSLDFVTCKDGVSAVEYLQVNENFLSEVSTCGWDGLQTLDVRRNAITSLDLSSCPSSNLTTVRASHNELETPPILPPALLHLDLSHNLLNSLPMITSTLMTADFSHNNFIEIGKSRFKRARKLLQLNLAHNHITHIKEHDLIGLRELRTLDISHNRLREISGASLTSLRNLQALYLQHNRLTKLDARDLASLMPRTVATLHHNPWLCSCQLLSALQRLQHCPSCQHQSIPVECKERGAWVAATAVLHSCLQAVQEVTQRLNDESDEDLSEEVPNDENSNTESKAVMAVPGLLVLVLIGAVIAMGYRLYVRHKRTITSRLHPFCSHCRFCGCLPETLNNNNVNSSQHGQLSQSEQDSDTETEL